MTHSITIIPGDGIGPEIITSVVRIIKKTNVKINWEQHNAGSKIFKQGISSGITNETIDSIKKNKILLKGPLETPVGYGEKSANVTLRKMFETYANVRPVRELPGIKSPYYGRNIDMVVIRENVEDLYGGIECKHTESVSETLKIISKQGCEKIIKFAFEYALSEGRKSIHCATKANIMKMTEGLMKKTFEDIAKLYPNIKSEHIIVDNCAHQMVMRPEQFDIIVTTNMNGDILSDLGSGLVGGLGFAPSANLGNNIAIFEAVHGSAPTIAGKNIANPTSIILSSVMMLRYLGELSAANNIEQALILTLEQNHFTSDVVSNNYNKLSTTEFTDKIIKNIGKKSKSYKERIISKINMPKIKNIVNNKNIKNIVGVDVFIASNLTTKELGEGLENLLKKTPMYLYEIANRGVKVYPNAPTQPDVVDSWQCRLYYKDQKEQSDKIIYETINKIGMFHSWVHIKKLFTINGEKAYSQSQGG